MQEHDSVHRTAEWNRFVDAMQAIRVDAQSLVEVVGFLEVAAGLSDEAARAAQVQADLAKARRIYRYRNLEDHAAQLTTARTDSPAIGKLAGDLCEKIANAVEDLRREGPWGPPTDPVPDVATVLAGAKKARQILDRLIVQTSAWWIREVLPERLTGRPIGQAVDLHTMFEAEMPNREARVILLGTLKNEEGRSFPGVLDVESGIVYVTSSKRHVRVLTYLAPVLLAVLLGLVLVLVPLLLPDLPVQGGSLLQIYLLVLAGMVLHLLIENVKVLDMAGEIVVLRDKLTWLHLRWVGVSLSVVPAAVVTFGLAFVDLGPTAGFVTYLAAGYSADSIAGLFLTRYQSSATKAVTSLKTMLTPAKVPPQVTAG